MKRAGGEFACETGKMNYVKSKKFFSQVPNKRGVLINRGVGKNSEI